MFGLIFSITLYGLIQLTTALDNCENGSPDCIVATIQEMSTRFDHLIYNRSCDHNAVFSQVYLIMTQYVAKYLTTVAANGSLVFSNYFYNPPYMSQFDRLFANYYLNPRDYWTSGQTNLVPQAWKIAFDAADNREMTALGDAILGMNAHINRDLPYIVATLGRTYADGTSGKGDYDLINDVLAAATTDVVNALATQYDPTIALLYDPLTDALFQQIVSTLRDNAWNNAIKLINAKSNPIVYSIVSSSIDTEAATDAVAFRALPILRANPSSRDALCRSYFGVI